MAIKQYVSLSEPLCGINTYKDVLNIETGATTRIIKKMVLDGNTVVKKKSGNAPFQIYCPHGIKPPTDGIYWLCSHYPAVPNTTTWTTYDYLISFSVGDMGESENDYFRIRDTSRASYNADQFSDYLAQQYANGTPVTVWYILATPETSVTTLPKGLSGTFEGSLTQTGTPTPASPIYPTANNINAFLNKKYFRYETSTDTITTLPVDLYADGTNATVGLVGNMAQTGTPSPTTPIQPSECGERTGNLFDKDNTTIYNAYIGTDGTWRLSDDSRSIKIPVLGNTQYTLSINSDNNAVFRIYESNNSSAVPVSGSSVVLSLIVRDTTIKEYTFTTSADTQMIVFQGSSSVVTEWFSSLMLNTGSTALPYEPYGYKIPILSANTTTPVYLGEVESTRKIAKYEFTGQEDDTILKMQSSGLFYLKIASELGYENGRAISSHYINQQVANVSMTDLRIKQDVSTSAFGSRSGVIVIKHTDYTTLADFKTYLQQQYAAGTPVTVWYVLKTEETGIVNEPLRKIGDYADTVSGISIPTAVGSNTVDVDTTLQPSEVTVNYHGWHPVQSVHEADNGAWD